jgi:hypothetical protein
MNQTTTERGFRIDEFTDANGERCSLQESSRSGEEGLIWLGCSEIGLKRLTPRQGWKPAPLECDPLGSGVAYSANNRMHLTQSQVRALLPALHHFAETGQLPAVETKD